MANLFDMFKQEKAADAKAAQERKAQKAKAKMRAIPQAALVVANILVLSLDYRVIEAVYKLTHNVALAVFAIFVSGAMFIFWFDVLYQYKLANDWQGYISLAASGLALVAAGLFAFLDYNISVQVNSTQSISLPTSVNFLFGSMVGLTVINAALLFWWYMIDEQIDSERLLEKNSAKRAAQQRNMDRVAALLDNADKLLAQKTALAKQYGAAEVEIMLSTVMGIDVDLNGDGVSGRANTPAVQMAATVQSVGSLTANPTNGANSQQTPPSQP